jgi:hypothetical protein
LEHIHPLLNGSRILSAIDIDLNMEQVKAICIINLYNPQSNLRAYPNSITGFNASITGQSLPLSSWIPIFTISYGTPRGISTLTANPKILSNLADRKVFESYLKREFPPLSLPGSVKQPLT